MRSANGLCKTKEISFILYVFVPEAIEMKRDQEKK